jgi:hypothetical protein
VQYLSKDIVITFDMDLFVFVIQMWRYRIKNQARRWV